jgi:hypothetical protein
MEIETVGPDEPAAVAYERTKANPHRRIVVLDDKGMLSGLLCLDRSLSRFCGGAVSRLDD